MYWFDKLLEKWLVELFIILEEGDTIEQGADFGFIKFGSRVDLFCH
jgi:hypothetical protein